MALEVPEGPLPMRRVKVGMGGVPGLPVGKVTLSPSRSMVGVR